MTRWTPTDGKHQPTSITGHPVNELEALVEDDGCVSAETWNWFLQATCGAEIAEFIASFCDSPLQLQPLQEGTVPQVQAILQHLGEGEEYDIETIVSGAPMPKRRQRHQHAFVGESSLDIHLGTNERIFNLCQFEFGMTRSKALELRLENYLQAHPHYQGGRWHGAAPNLPDIARRLIYENVVAILVYWITLRTLQEAKPAENELKYFAAALEPFIELYQKGNFPLGSYSPSRTGKKRFLILYG